MWAPSFKFTPCFSRHVAHWSTNFFTSSLIFSQAKLSAIASVVLVIPQCALLKCTNLSFSNLLLNHLSSPTVSSGRRVGGRAGLRLPPNQVRTSWQVGSSLWARHIPQASLAPSCTVGGSWANLYLIASSILGLMGGGSISFWAVSTIRHWAHLNWGAHDINILGVHTTHELHGGFPSSLRPHIHNLQSGEPHDLETPSPVTSKMHLTPISGE